MAEFSFAMKSLNQEFLGISMHFFSCFSTTFKVFFFTCIPCYSLKEENLWGFDINFAVGSLKLLFLYGISALLSGT